MKAKIKVDAGTFKKLPAAAAIANVGIAETYKAGGAIHVELTVKDPSALFELGGMVATISDEEVKAYEKRMAEKQAKRDGAAGK